MGFGADGDWFPLLDAIQFPGFAATFDTAAPADLKGYAPLWLGQTETRGMAQVWSGIIARTPAETSLLVRGPANHPQREGLQILEGIIEIDRWVGPLFGNLQLTRPSTPYWFPTHRPLFQVCPIPRAALSPQSHTVSGMDALSPTAWAALGTVIKRDSRRLGGYAVAARRRQKECDEDDKGKAASSSG